MRSVFRKRGSDGTPTSAIVSSDPKKSSSRTTGSSVPKFSAARDESYARRFIVTFSRSSGVT
jgi:hypothetical protein